MKWASAFKYVSINYDAVVATVSDTTQRVCFNNNLNGERVRLRFSNRFSKQPLRLDRVSVGVERNGTVENATEVMLDGNGVINLAPGQETFSDEIALTIRAGERLAVSVYIGEEQGVESVRCLWSRTNTLVTFGSGDHTDGSVIRDTPLENVLPLIKDDPSPFKTMFFYGFDALQVYTTNEVKVVAAFGDSITHMSFVTNALAKRLYAAYPGEVTLINCGVGGNRLVHDATFIKAINQVVPVFGEAGVKRFEKDVFELDEVDTVLALIGINDIMHPIQLEEKPETTAPEEIIEGYRTIAGIAHENGAEIFGATVTPCGSDDYPEGWLPAFEKTRQALNEWIRDESVYDGYFDYDSAVRDDSRPGYLLSNVHIGDGLHPNDKGGELIAAAVDLELITGFPAEKHTARKRRERQ